MWFEGLDDLDISVGETKKESKENSQNDSKKQGLIFKIVGIFSKNT